MSREELNRVLILGGGRGGSALLRMLLEEGGIKIVGVMDHNPDAPAMKLAAEHGIATFTDLEQALNSAAPCIAFNLTHNLQIEDVAAARLGVGNVIGGVAAYLFWQMVTQLQAVKEGFRYQANHDPLTGVYNRRFLLEMMENDLSEAKRYQFPYTIVIIDLDHFKVINDTHGHDAGDTVLKEATQRLTSCMRSADTLGRWGGEEFLVLLPHTTAAEGVVAARHWLEYMRAAPVEYAGKKIPVSFSAGVACFDGQGGKRDCREIIDALLAEADRCLYRAKEAGRGCVVGPQEDCLS